MVVVLESLLDVKMDGLLGMTKDLHWETMLVLMMVLLMD